MSAGNIVLCYLLIGVFASDTGFAWRSISTGPYRLKRQADCDGFRCIRSGECINEDDYCNGRVDCKDGTDETERCKTLGCPGFIFRCKYGACINPRLECDGKNDCKDGSDESSLKCLNNTNTIKTKCKFTQFECKSGQCINEDNKCDGTPDCTDNSDETFEICSKVPCPGYTFKCKYGACISIRGLCNGVKECYDGSDEDSDVCTDRPVTNPTVTPPVTPVTSTPPKGNRPPVITSPGSCVIPPQIKNGKWSIWNTENYDYQPGDRVVHSTFLEVNCSQGYDVSNDNGVIFCRNGAWSESIPQCLRVCPRPISNAVTNVSCTYRKNSVDCSKPFEGTYAAYSCAIYYELSTTYYIRYCSDGSWDLQEPTCNAVCGEKRVRIKELIIGGEKVERGNYPWTVALYRRKDNGFAHICGGSLITERVVVTAAHCVSRLQNGKAYPEDWFRVAVGKYYRNYSDPNDVDAEFSEVAKIFIPPYYRGSESRFEADIAVLIAKETFNTTEFIQRVCMDWDQNSYYANSLLGTNGTVTGWGYTVRGKNASNELKEITLPYVDPTSCYNGMPDKYKKYVIRDKMCAGYLDKGIGVCEGDSGGGLVFENPVKRRYYLRGVVSTSPQESGSCDEFKYALYTKVSEYIDYIREHTKV